MVLARLEVSCGTFFLHYHPFSPFHPAKSRQQQPMTSGSTKRHRPMQAPNAASNVATQRHPEKLPNITVSPTLLLDAVT